MFVSLLVENFGTVFFNNRVFYLLIGLSNGCTQLWKCLGRNNMNIVLYARFSGEVQQSND